MKIKEGDIVTPIHGDLEGDYCECYVYHVNHAFNTISCIGDPEYSDYLNAPAEDFRLVRTKNECLREGNDV
jgi:hypothetical protein